MFDSLQAGSAFVIVNNHHPKPFYYPLLAERGAILNWPYLQNGPGHWQVQMGKNADTGPGTHTVQQLSKDLSLGKAYLKR